MIRAYLGDVINDHKTPVKVKVHLPDKVTDYETKFGEQKIQLKVQINSISSEKVYETCPIHSVSNNIEIFMGEEIDDIIDDFLNLFYNDIKKQKKN